MRILALAAAALASAGAEVKVDLSGGQARLLVDGKPFFVQGAVAPGRFREVKRAGGNAVRTAARNLDAAWAEGLYALVGLPLANQRHGFDYRDASKVEQQRQRVQELVEKHRTHPGLLMWALGNEPEIHTTAEQRALVWREVEQLARLVKRLDPRHPVITVLGGQYKQVLHEVVAACPSLDAIGLNSYLDMLKLPEDVTREGWTKPYVVTEFGPRGHWQVAKTAWKIPIEDTSTEKADFYSRAYRHAVLNRPQALGAFVFHWAQHHEKTHTWYGLYLEDGSRTAALDVMQEFWTGKPPLNTCPRVSRIRLSGEPSMPAGSRFTATVESEDPDGDPLTVEWELRKDVADNPNVGGDKEEGTPPIPEAILSMQGQTAEARLPAQPGNYRLFATVRDGMGNAAVANVPLQARGN